MRGIILPLMATLLFVSCHKETFTICNNGKDDKFNGHIDKNCEIASVTICDQVWMSKNLDISKYRNGDVIPQVTDATEWASLTTGAWCYIEVNADGGSRFGKLYNWYAVHDARQLAPTGWHVPSDTEWAKLIDCLGGESVAGGKMKETGTTHWLSPNTGADNSSGFRGLPGGSRDKVGTFLELYRFGFWWSSTDLLVRYVRYSDAIAGRGNSNTTNGFSVRCVRD